MVLKLSQQNKEEKIEFIFNYIILYFNFMGFWGYFRVSGQSDSHIVTVKCVMKIGIATVY